MWSLIQGLEPCSNEEMEGRQGIPVKVEEGMEPCGHSLGAPGHQQLEEAAEGPSLESSQEALGPAYTQPQTSGLQAARD